MQIRERNEEGMGREEWGVSRYKARLHSFERVTKVRVKMADDVANVDMIKCVALFYKLVLSVHLCQNDHIRSDNTPDPKHLYFYNSL